MTADEIRRRYEGVVLDLPPLSSDVDVRSLIVTAIADVERRFDDHHR